MDDVGIANVDDGDLGRVKIGNVVFVVVGAGMPKRKKR